MPGKYEIEAVFSLSTSIEPEGVLRGIEYAEGVMDYEDTSSWDSGEVRSEGGVVSFTVEAGSEDEARDIAQLALDSAHYSDDSIEWEIEDYSISDITCVEEPMDLDQAKTILLALLNRLDMLTAEETAAISYILEMLTP